jgi:hypothetical protein
MFCCTQVMKGMVMKSKVKKTISKKTKTAPIKYVKALLTISELRKVRLTRLSEMMEIKKYEPEKINKMRIDSKSILRKKNGKYQLLKCNLDELMQCLVHQIQLKDRKYSKPLEIKEFSIDLTYSYGGKVDMRQMVNGSQKESWKRPED